MDLKEKRTPMLVCRAAVAVSAAGVCLSVLAAGDALAASAYDDTFNVPGIAPQWDYVTDSGLGLQRSVTDNNLAATVTGPVTPAADAIYLSSNATGGFRLSTAADFSFQIDYNLQSLASSGLFKDASVVLGLGRDVAGTDSAAIARTLFTTGGPISELNQVVYRVDNTQSLAPLAGGNASGTFTVDYDASLDRITLGNGVASYSLPFDIRTGTEWDNADLLYVSFGVRSQSGDITTLNATLDDFVITQGTAVAIPEPSSLALLGIAGLMVARRRR